jgi:UDP-N-acetylglucosamine diphosphorylase / glucose-1-phosphate thymidylyltransferase / UDP-N-acetylgalactosamine diphosphorylase / glucosamine-1-phosphate N-acetyltransferase / galactosamine-1-phosphate N-acetyltransferase
VGCFLGDHTKTGLGTLLNTGSSVGCFCNLIPAGPLMPKYLPVFTSWWNGSLREADDLSQLERTAAEVMRRRGAAFTEAHANLIRHLFAETAGPRRQALKEAEQRQLRRSA